MALKFKIDQAAFDGLAEHFQKEYKKQDDGSYTLDVEGGEDTGALKRAKEHEKGLRKKAEDDLKALKDKLAEKETELEELQTDRAKKGDKSAEVEQAWKKKLADREKELLGQIEATQKALRNQMEDSVASGLAAELAGDNAELLLPHLKGRLRAEIVDGKAVTKILDPEGNVSALTMDELKKEVLSSPKFSAVVIASKGSGGGAGGARKGAGGTQKKKLSEMTATEEALFARENPQEYQKMIASEQPAG